MKRVLVFAAVVLCANQAWALRFMGPPTTDIEAGQFGFGLDWTHSQFDIRYDDDWWSSPTAMESDMYFASVLFGIGDGAQISGSVGVTDIDKSAHDSAYHSGNDLAWGVGTKLNLGKAGPVDIGVSFQMTSFVADDREYVGASLTRDKYSTYLWELAVGPSYETHGVCVYGGPFLHLITGEFEQWVNGAETTSMDIEEEGAEVGLYAGISAEIVENTDVGMEYHYTDDSWAIGVGLVHKFGKAKKVQSTARKPSSSWPELPKSEPKPVVKKSSPKTTLKVDAEGKPVKDMNGNFVFVPVE